MQNITCTIYFNDLDTARKKLFEEALLGAKHGRVLYVLHEELDELPQLSQELNLINKHYMKMITFLYVKSLDSLIETISTLPDWKNIPSTIILDNLSTYGDTNNLQNACGVVALLLDTAQSCSVLLKSACRLYISVSKTDNACGVVALLLDTAQSCSVLLKSACRLYISVSKTDVSEDYYNTLQELFCVQRE